jgi:hemolysin activation/secretion protein
LREIERSTGKRQVAPAPLSPTTRIPASVPLPERAGAQVFVSAFRIHATRFSETELQAVIKEYANRAVTLAELQAATRKIGDYYRQHDYLAYAYLPPQTIRNGVVEIAVVEANLGKIRMDPTAHTRLNPSVALGLVTHRSPPGQPLRPGQLDEAIAVLNELPGVQRATSLLAPGANTGESDAMLHIEDAPVARGSLASDNTGSEGTGQWQGFLSGSLDNPFGRGEQFQVNTLKSEGSSYARLGGSLPLGSSGLRVGANGSAMAYQVRESVSPLDLNGSSWTAGLSLDYPVRRSAGLSLTASTGFDFKHMVDRMADDLLGDKQIGVGYFSLSGQVRDDWFGGGANLLAATVNLGSLDLSRNPDQYQGDQVTARTHGGYGKLHLSLSREQPIGNHVTLLTQLLTQWSPSNLDSSEKFSLGGFYGVRAYPAGEASGDSGWLANVEARWQIMDGLQLSGFYDMGWIRQHARLWAEWQPISGQPNDYRLQGVGLGMRWSPNAHFQTQALLAYAIGDNPGSDAAGNDSDGADNSLRAWLQLSLNF